MRLRVILCCAITALGIFPVAAEGARPLRTGFELPRIGSASESDTAFARVKAAGTTFVRLTLYWNSAEPTHGVYNWSYIDGQVQDALDAGLTPAVTIWKAPSWAEDRTKFPKGQPGTVAPNPAAFGGFARAAALHLKGKVRYWEAWNEPNLTYFLAPQWVNGSWFSAAHYRKMVNAFAAGVRGADSANIVIAGATAPHGKVTATNRNPAPLTFMRALLCLSSTNRPIAGCGEPVQFDAWSTHPYTTGGPTHQASSPNNVSLGDLPDMRRVLSAGIRYGRVASSRPVEFWVGEFSWDSNRPDPAAVPMRLHTRWVAEALHQAYRSGVSTFIWHQLSDLPYPKFVYQSGLYYCGRAGLRDESSCSSSYTVDRPKPSLRAFTFPFVAYAGSGRNRVWGRTPPGAGSTVVVQRKSGWRWIRWKTVTANDTGIFSGSWRSSKTTGFLRATTLVRGRVLKSAAFSLQRPADRSYAPFGSGG
jgi:hypothetical protein